MVETCVAIYFPIEARNSQIPSELLKVAMCYFHSSWLQCEVHQLDSRRYTRAFAMKLCSFTILYLVCDAHWHSQSTQTTSLITLRRCDPFFMLIHNLFNTCFFSRFMLSYHQVVCICILSPNFVWLKVRFVQSPVENLSLSFCDSSFNFAIFIVVFYLWKRSLRPLRKEGAV